MKNKTALFKLFRKDLGERREETWERKMNKKAIEMEMIGWWIIALAVLVLLVIGVIYMKSKGIHIIDYVKDLFRFRK